MPNKAHERAALALKLRQLDDKSWTMRLYGVVGSWWDELEDEDVLNALDKVPEDDSLTIHVNSPGGVIYHGLAMATHISQRKNTTVVVDGMAASAATFITSASSNVMMAPGSLLMIHEPWGFALGEEKDMLKSAEVLAKWRESIITLYRNKTGQSRERLAEMMADETWMTAEEAVELGFADGILERAVSHDDDDETEDNVLAFELPAGASDLLKNCKNLPGRVAAAMAGRGSEAAGATAQPVVNTVKNEEIMPDSINSPRGGKNKAAHEHTKTNKVAEDELSKARAEGAETERQRVAEIKNAGKDLPPEFVASLIDDGLTIEEAQAAIDRLKPFLEKDNPVNGINRIEITRDAEDTRRSSVEQALLNRSNPSMYPIESDSPAREYANLSLMEIANESLEQAGLNPRQMTRTARAQGALSTSDFPIILGNVASKVLADSYELAPRTFLPLGVRQTLPDFKDASHAGLGQASTLEKVGAGGEYTSGVVGERGERYRLYKYGRIIPFTWEAIVNDDLRAFTRVPALLAAAAAQKESDIFWATVTGNPQMSDGKNLFSADHRNQNSTSADITVESIGAARAAMRAQRDGGHFLSANPRYLVVPTAMETEAEQFTATAISPTESAKVNPFAGRLQVISEPRLDSSVLGGGATYAWYLWADPSQIDTIAYAYLQGEEGPQISTRQGFEIDGLQLKVRHVFAAAPLDWRGMYRQKTES